METPAQTILVCSVVPLQPSQVHGLLFRAFRTPRPLISLPSTSINRAQAFEWSSLFVQTGGVLIIRVHTCSFTLHNWNGSVPGLPAPRSWRRPSSGPRRTTASEFSPRAHDTGKCGEVGFGCAHSYSLKSSSHSLLCRWTVMESKDPLGDSRGKRRRTTNPRQHYADELDM